MGKSMSFQNLNPQIWNSKNLQDALQKCQELEHIKNEIKNTKFSIKVVSFAMLGSIAIHIFHPWGNATNLFAAFALIFSPALIVGVIQCYSQVKNFKGLENKWENQTHATIENMKQWLSIASSEDLKVFLSDAPTNVYNTFFDEYQTAKQRIFHVHH